VLLLDNNILVQIDLVVPAGLAEKNSILIVEFNKQAEAEARAGWRRRRGRGGANTADPDNLVRVHPRRCAGGDRRRRGCESRISLGTAVFWGMLGVTLFGLIFTPVIYVVCRRLGGRIGRAASPADPPQPALGPTA
jgi:multidrug efflux pump subunit AcrB